MPGMTIGVAQVRPESWIEGMWIVRWLIGRLVIECRPRYVPGTKFESTSEFASVPSLGAIAMAASIEKQ